MLTAAAGNILNLMTCDISHLFFPLSLILTLPSYISIIAIMIVVFFHIFYFYFVRCYERMCECECSELLGVRRMLDEQTIQ